MHSVFARIIEILEFCVLRPDANRVVYDVQTGARGNRGGGFLENDLFSLDEWPFLRPRARTLARPRAEQCETLVLSLFVFLANIFGIDLFIHVHIFSVSFYTYTAPDRVVPRPPAAAT